MLQLPLNRIILLLIFYFVYWTIRKWLLKSNWLLFLFGIAFYSWGHVFQGALLITLTFADYLLARFIFPVKRFRKAGLIFGLLLNIGLWLIFKFDLPFLQGLGTQQIPLGISFYTLRKISILVSCHKNPKERVYSFIEYGLYVSFFPQILSGPLEKPDQFIQQVRYKRTLSGNAFIESVKLIILGLLKKQVIADNLRVIVDRVFQLDSPSRILALVGTMGFALQVFSDFSGYTDISRGLSGFLGFKTSKNFNRPFLAVTPREFWNRWHITLTNWLQSYVFFPIRRVLVRKFPNNPTISLFFPPIVTMLVSGFWHGVGWSFIAWGLYHGILIVIYRALRVDTRLKEVKWPGKMSLWIISSIFLLFGWLLFRAPDLTWIYKTLFSNGWGISDNTLIVALSLASQIFLYSLPLIVYRLAMINKKFVKIGEPIFYAAALVVLMMFSMSGIQEFIYFGF